jgi:hypothetical protein
MRMQLAHRVVEPGNTEWKMRRLEQRDRKMA